MKQRYMAARIAIIVVLLVVGMSVTAMPGAAQSGIPEGATIHSAYLRLMAYGIVGGGEINVHRVTAPWDEGTVTWTSFGGSFAPEIYGTFTPIQDPVPTLVDVTGLVQAWVQGVYPNHGFLLAQGPGGNTIFWSSEYGVVTSRPALEICYSTPTVAFTCVTLQRSILGQVADAFISEQYSGQNYGAKDLYTGLVNGYQKQSLLWFDLPTVPTGCTLTPGYWKTHSEYGPAPYDATWAMLPYGADTPFFGSGKSYYEALWTAPKGNAYYILAHAYIAAELNGLNGASAPAEVSGAMSQASALLAAYNGSIPKKSADRQLAIDLAALLDAYNNGDIGPGHCYE